VIKPIWLEQSFFNFLECRTSYGSATGIVKGFVTQLTQKAEAAHSSLAIGVQPEYYAWRYVSR
jgi:hypothetical protein